MLGFVRLRWFALAGSVVLLDQLSKTWISSSFRLYESRELLPMLSLTLMHNEGAAFSMLSEQGGWQRWFLTVLAAGLSILIVVWMLRLPVRARIQGVALALILGGALGNLIDRLRFGYVVDFIDVYVDDWHWPAFNIADAAITVGAVVLIVLGFFQGPDEGSADGQGA